MTKYERYTAIKAELDKVCSALERLRVLDDRGDEKLDDIMGPVNVAREPMDVARAKMRQLLVGMFRAPGNNPAVERLRN